MINLDQEARFPRWARTLSVLLVVAVALFARLYGHDPDALLGFEEMDLFGGVDFVLSFAYHLEQPGYPVREFWQARFPNLLPPLEVHSPFMNRPWVPAQEYNAVVAAHTSGTIFVPRPLGGNLGMPFEGRVYSGYPKTFFNIGIQRDHPGTPQWFLGGLSAVFLGEGITNFSLNLLPPIVAFRLPSVLFSTLTCLAVFYVARRWLRSDWAAVFASLFLALEPIFLTASRDAKIDTSQAFFTLMIAWTYWEARERHDRRWLILTGILVGLGLATKGQAILLPFMLVAWDVLRRWLRDDVSRLNLLRPLFLIGFFLLVLGLPFLALGYRVIPAQIMARAFESAWGFTVSIVGSYLFALLACLGLAWPLGQSMRVLRAWPRSLRSVSVRSVVSAENRRQVSSLVLDLVMLMVIAVVAFVIAVPNTWGAPLKWIWGWLTYYKNISNELRSTYFVTRTVYLPVYYYLVILLIKGSLPFLAALTTGLVVSVGWLKRHRLRDSSASRALLLMWVVGISYLLLASATPFHKEPKELVPVFPFFAMWAGLGMTWLVSYIARAVQRLIHRQAGKPALSLSNGPALSLSKGPAPRFLPRLSVLAGVGIAGVGLFTCITHVPYTGICYNHLIGPPENGARIEWLNFNVGSGYERAARYISQVYGNDKKVLGSGEVGWLNMSYPNVYTVDPLSPEATFQDVYELVQDYDVVVVHRMETQRRPHFVFHQFFARQTPVYRIVINGVEVIRIFDIRQVKPLAGSEVDETAHTTRMLSVP